MDVGCRIVGALVLAGAACLQVEAQPLVPGGEPPWPESYLRRTGEMTLPVLLVNYQNVSGTLSRTDFESILKPGSPLSLNVSAYYREVSYDQLRLDFDVFDWRTLADDDDFYEGGPGCQGLCDTKRIDALVGEAVALHDAGVDFTRYDNDGLDGVPDSGDDDGFVDALLVVHPETSGCDDQDESVIAQEGKFYNLLASDPKVLLTSDLARSGRPVAVNEYLVIGAAGCDGARMTGIGNFAHELGHALGLPDLYDVDHSSGGIGWWGLMGDGGLGWGGNAADEPLHLSAWGKVQLGWVRPRQIEREGLYRLPKVEEQPVVFKIPVLESDDGEYYLLEHRAQVGFDRHLPASGLLIWRINPRLVDGWQRRARSNGEVDSLNDDENRKAVKVVEAHAEGYSEIDAWINSGDAGDLFPDAGPPLRDSIDNTTHPRTFGAVALCDIQRTGDEVRFQFVPRHHCP